MGYLELKKGPLEFTEIVPYKKPALGILVCSRDDCEYTELKAAPESLTLAKRTLRDTYCPWISRSYDPIRLSNTLNLNGKTR
ncbi:hypothetical protein Back11_60910 [Paenibacillus baekrokdamisoli]|uniref:Uncharacterized protein n=1 Tax=Paenibacillus baekrokdamisoli TaxID=1712516 RepID=A0A3G9J1V9_9BACL|nr:hypothetical protein Back11_60910 [Paenibacillus baekrokdamisoli]